MKKDANSGAFAEHPTALDYTVVELGSRIASSYTGKLLAELGAQVIKVEPPEGDPLRNGTDAELALFAYLHGSKSSLSLDLKSSSGSAALKKLLQKTDLLIDGLSTGELAALGIDIAETNVKAAVQITDFGQTGPYAHFESSDLIVQAAGGWVIDRGQTNQIPVQVGGSVHEYTAGVYAAVALLTAGRHHRLNGDQVIADLSVSATLQATIPFQEIESGADPTFLDLSTRPFPMTIVPAQDGWVGLNCLTGQQWRDACAMVGAPEYETRREDIRADRDLLKEFTAKVLPWFSSQKVSDVVELGQAFRIPAAPLGNADRLLHEQHFVERKVFVENKIGDLTFRQPRPPFRLSRTPARADIGLPQAAEVSP